MNLRMHCRIILLLLGTLFSPYSRAAEQTATHRITGLFSPEREADLRSALEKFPEIKLVRLDFSHAEGSFTYDPAKAFPGTKPADIVKKFDEQLRNASNHTLGVQPLSTTAKDQLTRVEIPVAGLDCKACCLAAYEIIYKIEGVEQATASFKEGRITALIDAQKTGRPALEEALKKRGVTVKTP
ncbi:MAG TPA: heavy metal-associated domain-containing protein [Candidatus Saccharimonadales bacterium]|nr:heavy metal-associated domain-containing protein [Candidatus Saccharimonadales bacterium]